MELSWNDVNLKKVNIIVSKSQMNSFVEVVGNSVGKDEFILTENGKKLKTTQNKEGIKLNQLGSLSSGSKNFITRNIADYSEFIAKKRS